MRKIIILTILVLLIRYNNLIGQYYFLKFPSDLVCKVDSSDAAFLKNCELRIWKAAVSNSTNAPHIYSEPNIYNGFTIMLSRGEIQTFFKDSFPTHSFSRAFDLNIHWHPSGDTFSVMAFSHINQIGKDSICYEDSSQPGFWQCPFIVQYRTPLEEYFWFHLFTNNEKERIHRIVISQLASKIKATKCNQDTLFDQVTFDVHDKNILPQAQLPAFLSFLKNGLLIGSLNVFSDSTLTKKITRSDIDASLVNWDSTHLVDDPNNPGTQIYAPIKIECNPYQFIICEKWIPLFADTSRKSTTFSFLALWSYVTYCRRITAYGMRLSPSGKVLWLDPKQVDNYIAKNNFDFTPYKETFRAELFRRMQIRVQ